MISSSYLKVCKMCVQVWRRLCVVCKAEATKRSVKV